MGTLGGPFFFARLDEKNNNMGKAQSIAKRLPIAPGRWTTYALEVDWHGPEPVDPEGDVPLRATKRPDHKVPSTIREFLDAFEQADRRHLCDLIGEGRIWCAKNCTRREIHAFDDRSERYVFSRSLYVVIPSDDGHGMEHWLAINDQPTGTDAPLRLGLRNLVGAFVAEELAGRCFREIDKMIREQTG